MPDRKQPTDGCWITVALVVVLAGYPLKFGPACWITSRLNLPGDWLVVVYRPITSAIERRSGILFEAVRWYSFLGASKEWGWLIDDNDGRVRTFEPGP